MKILIALLLAATEAAAQSAAIEPPVLASMALEPTASFNFFHPAGSLRLIGWDRDAGVAADAVAEYALTREDFGVRCDSHAGQLAALRAGLGIGACHYPIAARDPDLLPVLADRVRFPL